MISGNINCSKITKDRLFKGKDGGMNLNFVLLETPNDKYGNDYMVIESITKEERDAGKKGVILGNAKIFRAGGATNSQAPAAPVSSDDLPF